MKKLNILYIGFVALVILFGIFLRMKGYLANPSMWHDECNLAMSILDYNLFDFFHKKLEFIQVAPPLFMFFTKLLTKIAGFSEYVFRFIPLLSGCGAIVLFYLVGKYYFKSKTARIISLILFCLNTLLIYYSSEFKQYETDVFCSLAVLYAFNRVDFSRIDWRKTFLAGCAFATIIWLSFVSGIVVMAGIIAELFKSKDYKKISVLASPVLVMAFVYGGVFLFNAYTGTPMAKLWDDEFVSRNFANFPVLFVNSLQFFFSPVKNLLFMSIFFIWGTALYIKNREKNALIVFLSIAGLIFLSWLKLYPFAQRVILFILPFYMLVLFKPFELLSWNKKTVSVILCLMFVLTFTPQFLITGKFIAAKNSNKRDPAREFSKYLYENISPDDKIFVSRASTAEFEFYEHFYPLENKVLKESAEANLLDTRVTDCVEMLKKEKGKIWIYMPYDIPHRGVADGLSNYLTVNEKVLQNWRFGQSVLMYVTVR